MRFKVEDLKKMSTEQLIMHIVELYDTIEELNLRNNITKYPTGVSLNGSSKLVRLYVDQVLKKIDEGGEN